ncbi:hypothetical protein [Tateyamaria sp. SN3-11]|uniref:hypothetical protein n=1 Tax=Tateyamaria sp. SN3-11 TaxID=3092147 RepID=UPI0039EA2C81
MTPLIEDGGLFARPPIEIEVELVPRIGKNGRGDIVIKGYVSANAVVDVVIAGRRKEQARPLLSSLQTLWSNANRGLSSHVEPPDAEQVRLSARVVGSWRPYYQVDDQGWQTHEFQLLAARWTFSPKPGVTQTFGEPPLF